MSHQSSRVEHTYEVISTLQAILASLTDVQGAVRGYLISESEDYLAPYHAALPSIQSNMAKLEKLVSDNPEQYERSKSLAVHVDERLSIAANTIATYKKEGQESAFEIIREGTGKREMDTIRFIITDMTSSEQSLLDVRRVSVEDFTNLTLVAGIAGVIICIVILLSVFYLIYRETRLRLSVEAMLKEQSIRDALTKLHNRRYLEETLPREMSRMERNGKTLGLMIMDIDHFKKVNDTYGHDGGDAVLTAFAALLQRKVRKEDMACRLGGEEFVLVFPDIDKEFAAARAEDIRADTRKISVRHGGQIIQVSVSIGVALYSAGPETPDALIARADQCLYRAKNGGRDRVVIDEDGAV